MLKAKEFNTSMALLLWVNSQEGIGRVVSVVVTENRDMSSYYVWTVFYNECSHIWGIKETDSHRTGQATAICVRCGVTPNPLNPSNK